MDATLTIRIPSDVQQALDDQARREGTTAESLAVEALRERFAPARRAGAARGAGTLADLLAAHVGVLDSGERVPGGARMSERRKEYGDLLLRDHRERHP